MLSIKIDSADLDYLLGSRLEKSICATIQSNYVKKFDTVYLNIETPIAEAILDFLGNELMRGGISENDKPNEFGIMLESLIDKISREFYN